MSGLEDACEAAALELQPGFADALVRLSCLLRLLESTLAGDVEVPESTRMRVFGLLSRLYADLRASTRSLDDDPAQAAAKRRHVQAFRDLVGAYLWQAPFFRHSYEKPRGYAGDFEMMEMLYDSRIEGATTFARLLQEHFMRGEGPRSVRSRREYLRQRLVSRIVEDGTRRVLSVAAGSAAEVRDLFEKLPDASVEVFLLDRDPGALGFARNALGAPRASGRVRELVMSVRDVAEGSLEEHGPFGLVYSTGLYDYLDQPFAVSLTRRLIESLVPGGELLIANYASEHVNPDRFIVEYAQDWFLVTRSEDEMRRLVDEAPVENVTLERDAATGSIHFLTARRRR